MKAFLFGLLALPLTLLAADTVKAAGKLEKATFAGGCFWCMEHPFDALPGVVSVTSGYTGGQKKYPTYQEVSAGGTGHAESVQIVFDPSKISYGKLLDVYWHNIDPTTKDRQFCDAGNQYRSAIFYHTEEQHRDGVAVERGAGKGEALQGAGGHRDRARGGILPGGGVPPALLQEEPDPLPVLQERMRPGPAAQGALGERGRRREVAERDDGRPVSVAAGSTRRSRRKASSRKSTRS